MRYLVSSIIFLIYSSLPLYAQSLNPKQDVNGKWGYQKEENWIIQPKFDAAYHFYEGLAGVKIKNKIGFVNLYGELVIPYKYDDILSFSSGYAAVKLNGKWGYIDKSGKLNIAYKYDDAKINTEGLAAVKLYGKWGFLDIIRDTIVVPFKYDNAAPFSNGLSAVRINGKNGFIDRYGNWYNDKNEFIPLFSDYAKNQVERSINSWQQKGKYEKTIDWQNRVNQESRNKKITELTREAEKNYLIEQGKKVQLLQQLHQYDADNEVFLIKDEKFGNLLVPVPINEAENFEKHFFKLKRSVRYFVENDKLALAELSFTMPSGNVYKYSNSASVDYFITNIDYKFAPIEIDSTQIYKIGNKGLQNIRYSKLSNGVSDIDINIPVSKKTNENTFVVIVANEIYKYEDSVPYSKADGESFQNYCLKTLGIPEENIHFCSDATLNEMRYELKWLRDLGSAYGNTAKIIFYYTGHGIPNEQTGDSYLLPVDGSGRDSETGLGLSNLFTQLGELPVKSVSIFLDACFSGEKREGGMMLAAKGVVVKKKEATSPINGKLVVFSASQNDQTAMLHPQQGHGLFTYYLLKKLQESKGGTTLGELADYVITNVKQKSIIVHRKSQEPTVVVSPSISNSWYNLKLQ